jgi:putative endonuclease
MYGGWVYIMTNRRNGTLYVGVTNNVMRRAHEHREGKGSSFTRRYKLTRLVYYERHEDILSGIQRGKTIKDWPRARNPRLIQALNPAWNDLYDPVGL